MNLQTNLQDIAKHIRSEAEYKSDGKSGSTITILIPVAEAEAIAQALEAFPVVSAPPSLVENSQGRCKQ